MFTLFQTGPYPCAFETVQNLSFPVVCVDALDLPGELADVETSSARLFYVLILCLRVHRAHVPTFQQPDVIKSNHQAGPCKEPVEPPPKMFGGLKNRGGGGAKKKAKAAKKGTELSDDQIAERRQKIKRRVAQCDFVRNCGLLSILMAFGVFFSEHAHTYPAKETANSLARPLVTIRSQERVWYLPVLFAFGVFGCSYPLEKLDSWKKANVTASLYVSYAGYRNQFFNLFKLWLVAVAALQCVFVAVTGNFAMEQLGACAVAALLPLYAQMGEEVPESGDLNTADTDDADSDNQTTSRTAPGFAVHGLVKTIVFATTCALGGLAGLRFLSMQWGTDHPLPLLFAGLLAVALFVTLVGHESAGYDGRAGVKASAIEQKAGAQDLVSLGLTTWTFFTCLFLSCVGTELGSDQPSVFKLSFIASPGAAGGGFGDFIAMSVGNPRAILGLGSLALSALHFLIFCTGWGWDQDHPRTSNQCYGWTVKKAASFKKEYIGAPSDGYGDEIE